MTRRRRSIPPGRRKALREERQAHRERTGRATPRKEYTPNGPYYGVPGCNRTQEPLREAWYGSLDPFLCGSCGGGSYFDIDTGRPEWPRRRVCATCHPPGRGIAVRPGPGEEAGGRS